MTLGVRPPSPPFGKRGALLPVAAVFIIAALTGFLPLFGAPGYEQSLLAGLWVPTFAAIAQGGPSFKVRTRWSLPRMAMALQRGALFAGAALAGSLVHVLRGEGCGAWEGCVYYAWTAAPGILLGALWGALVNGFVPQKIRWRRAIVTAAIVAGPLGSALVSVGRFLSSPMIFAYDPFVGFFSGSLYDTVIDPGVALYTYRLGSGLTVLALFFATARRELHGAQKRVATALFALAACASLFVTANGPRFGHWHTKASIEDALGESLEGPRCRVVFPGGTPHDDAALLLRDCEAELKSAENWLELDHNGPKLTAFFFRDPGQKRVLMGAEHTYIAKPWRNEVYLQLASFPHPVLGHEIAHVVAGRAASGPFRVGGAVSGLWPNPGLIEGMATAVSPDDDELTDAQWTRAILADGKLAPMEHLFSFQFFGANSAKGYTVAGAFVTWVRATFGATLLKHWYAGGDLPALTNQSWKALDDGFRAWLLERPFPESAQSYAKGRFERPGLFGRKCPHRVDALRGDGDRLRGAGKGKDALCKYDEALSLDGADWQTQLARASLVSEEYTYTSGVAPEDAPALAPVFALMKPASPPALRDRAEELLADALWFGGALPAAGTHWRALATRTLDEDAGRNFEVKAQAADSDPELARAVGALLLGESRRRAPNLLLAGALLAQVKGPGEGLSHYLLGKNFVNQRDWKNARAELFHPTTDGPLPARVGRELLRQRAIVACILHDATGMTEVRASMSRAPSPFTGSSGGRREALQHFLDRCADEGSP